MVTVIVVVTVIVKAMAAANDLIDDDDDGNNNGSDCEVVSIANRHHRATRSGRAAQGGVLIPSGML